MLDVSCWMLVKGELIGPGYCIHVASIRRRNWERMRWGPVGTLSVSVI
jgi:hypothetical protein